MLHLYATDLGETGVRFVEKPQVADFTPSVIVEDAGAFDGLLVGFGSDVDGAVLVGLVVRLSVACGGYFDGFEVAHVDLAPTGDGHGFDLVALNVIARLEFVVEVGYEGAETLVGFGADEDAAGEVDVGMAVEGGVAFAFGVAGPVECCALA